VITALADQVIRYLAPPATQPELPLPDLPKLQLTYRPPTRPRSLSGQHFRVIGSPSVYIAASFSAYETATASPTEAAQEILFDVRHSHGKLSRTTYRRHLTGLSVAVQAKGFTPVLPHRDVNAWGRRQLEAEVVADTCLRLVRECDIFIGVLHESYGSHAEAGAALAFGKPCIIVSVGNAETFFGRGIRKLRSTVSIHVESMAALVRLAKSDEFWAILARAERAARDRSWSA
jgi:hypothetical protein